jgi:hypothetical protein
LPTFAKHLRSTIYAEREVAMRLLIQCSAACAFSLASCLVAGGQQQPSASPPSTPPQAAGAVAATVNDQPIYEKAVARALKGVPPDLQTRARTDILNRLIEHAALDQYLLQLHVEVPKQDVDTRVGQLRDELKKSGKAFEKMLEDLSLSEEELREQISAELRWEKFSD